MVKSLMHAASGSDTFLPVTLFPRKRKFLWMLCPLFDYLLTELLLLENTFAEPNNFQP